MMVNGTENELSSALIMLETRGKCPASLKICDFTQYDINTFTWILLRENMLILP